MRSSRFVVVALISMTLLGLELIWTKIFSAEFFYTFAFLTLSLAVMGLGLGALALRLFPFLDKERNLSAILTLTGLSTLVAPPAVIHLGVDYSLLFSDPVMLLKFVASVMLLSASYFFAGIALGLYFKYNYRDMPRLYMADLLGAGLGVVAAIALMNSVGTPAATFLFAVPVLAAALIVRGRWIKAAPALLIVASVFLLPGAMELLERPREERAPVIYRHWDAMAKLKVWDYGGLYRGIVIDNVANSPVISFDGNWDESDTTGSDWDINVRYLVKQFDSCSFLSLGAGGGADVLQALDHGATDIYAVEVNPQINRMMLVGDPWGYIQEEPPTDDSPDDEQLSETSDDAEQSDPKTDTCAATDSTTNDTTAGTDSTVQARPPEPPPPPPPVIRDSSGHVITLADFSGHIYSDPRVHVISEDARTYVRRHRGKFDVIFSLSSNTWAALASGSFALAENYLFTTEAFLDYWNALSDSGFLSMEHQMYVPRLVTEALDALKMAGVENPREHVAVYNLPKMHRMLLLMSKRPLTDELRYNAYGPLTPERSDFIHLLYPASEFTQDSLVYRIVTEGWQAVADSTPIDLSPGTDNRPYTAQLGLWKNFNWARLDKISQYADFTGFPLSKLVMVVILGVVLLLIIPLNLVPYFVSREKLRAVPWLYFFTIGLAFMALEVVLIQKYALFIGASVYSIATVLLTLLVASGIGSCFADRVSDSVPFIGIVIWLAADILLFGHITQSLVGLTILPRALVSALMVFPLGFFMGMPFPKGTLRVGPLIDWGFAVNGAASVLGATAIVLVAFEYGFTAALMVGGGLYLAAGILMLPRKAW